MKESLQPGLSGRLEYVVPEGRTVPHLLPESAEFTAMPAVLATGYLVGIVEWACIRALEGHLDPGEQTLGVHVDLSHDAPTPSGETLSVGVELIGVDRRQLSFDFQVADESAVVSPGYASPGGHRPGAIRRPAEPTLSGPSEQVAAMTEVGDLEVLASTSSARPSTGEAEWPNRAAEAAAEVGVDLHPSGQASDNQPFCRRRPRQF